MRSALLLFLIAGCASSGGAAAGSDASGPETLRSTGAFIRSCLENAAWSADFTKAKKAKPKVQLSPIKDNVGGADTNAMLSAIENALLKSGTADVLPWGDALAGIAAYQSDAMALGGNGEASVTNDPDFIVGGTIERIAEGGTATMLRLLDSSGNGVCEGKPVSAK
jgi:hypothetical protein